MVQGDELVDEFAEAEARPELSPEKEKGEVKVAIPVMEEQEEEEEKDVVTEQKEETSPPAAPPPGLGGGCHLRGTPERHRPRCDRDHA